MALPPSISMRTKLFIKPPLYLIKSLFYEGKWSILVFWKIIDAQSSYLFRFQGLWSYSAAFFYRMNYVWVQLFING